MDTLSLAKMYRNQKKYDQAIEAYRSAINPNAENQEEIHFALGRIYEDCKRYNEAMKEYVNSLSIKYQKETFYRFITLCRSIKEWRLLEEWLLDDLAIVPEDNLFLRNLVLNEIEILQKKMVLGTKVRNLIVTLTNRCNLHCRMCEARHYPWEMPKEIVEEIIAFFPYLEYVMWQGGEVFLVDYFGDILEEAKRYPQMKQLIVTNGLLFSEDLIKKLLDQPELVLAISIDGVSKDVYEKIRRGGNFARLKENIDILNSMRKEYNSSISLHLNVTVMKSNCHQLLDFIEFAKKYRFDSVLLRPVQGNLNNEENIFSNKAENALDGIDKVLAEVEERAGQYKILMDNRISSPKSAKIGHGGGKRKKGLFCYAPWQRLYISWGGNVYPDCMCIYPPDTGIGNVTKNSLKEIWNNEGMQLYRRRIIEKDYPGLCNPDCISGLVPERYLKFNK